MVVLCVVGNVVGGEEIDKHAEAGSVAKYTDDRKGRLDVKAKRQGNVKIFKRRNRFVLERFF